MTFKDLNINHSLLNALEEMGLSVPTPIQYKGFSVAMSGKDMVGIAQTGTGKTLAYLLPCLRQWAFNKEKHPTILIVVPTRELVVQVVEEVEKLTKYMNVIAKGVFGGANINTQALMLRDGVDVLVATPGRLLDLSLNGGVKLKYIKRFVVDEVDEMLDLGFRPQLVRVMDLLPDNRQNLMFSATMTDEINAIIDDFFDHPVTVEAAPNGTPLENISQSAYFVPNFNTKANLLKYLLNENKEMNKVLVFIDSKKLADRLFDIIAPAFEGVTGVIHSNKAQNNRFATVQHFKDGDYRILIATDIIARGLDVSEVSHVINFDLPDNPETYIHRIGRTGRADKKGIALAFITEKEKAYQEEIELLMKREIDILDFPATVAISDVLIEEEKPVVKMKTIQVKITKKETDGAAFHERSAKRQKVNVRTTRKSEMGKKYSKPQKRRPKK
ncbi:MAG: DEAD/DEAH box helicase [Saprospiraceae bacterium]